MTDAANQHVVLLLSHVQPQLGLERCALRLAKELPRQVDLVSIGERDGDLEGEVVNGTTRAVTLGPPVRGWRRVVALRRLRTWSKTNENLVIAAGVWAAVPLLIVRRRAAYPVIVWEHSLSSEKISSSRGLRALSLAARLLYRRAERIVVVSPDLANDVKRLTGHPKIEVIPNYLPDLPDETATMHARRVYSQREMVSILTVGSLSVTKNQQMLISALSYLPDNYELVIAGDGPTRATLERQVAGLCLRNRVRWLGHVEEMAPFYAAADILVQPALGETFGMAMFEAASLDIPVVAVNYAHARSLIPKLVVGRLSDSSPASVATEIRRTLEEPPSSAVFSAARSAREAEFGDEAITESWLRICAGKQT